MNLILFISPLISLGSTLFGILFLWWYTRDARAVAITAQKGQTVESAVSAVKDMADARLDEIKLLRSQLADLTQAMAAQKAHSDADISALERRVDDLETRNASLRRRLDRYEIEHDS